MLKINELKNIDKCKIQIIKILQKINMYVKNHSG